MIYRNESKPINYWPPLIRYPSYHPDPRLSILWFLVLTILSLTLSVVALIIVFAVEHSWFQDSFNGNKNRYGLWRLCFWDNNTCDSWFSTSGAYNNYVGARLDQSKNGINAWQALEIVFLFLTTSTLIIAIASLACYRCRNSFHYYLAVLAVFCIWPSVCVGISSLFVFGFAVYNVATTPRDLDWCFYVNLVAVILALLGAILLSIYDALLEKPIRDMEEDTVIETFGDIEGFPATLSPSTFIIVRKDRRKRAKPYDYPRILYPNYFAPTITTAATSTNQKTGNTDANNTNYSTNLQHKSLTPYTSIVTTQETNVTSQRPTKPPLPPPISQPTFEYTSSNFMSSTTQPFRPSPSPHIYQSRPSQPYWNRPGPDVMNPPISYTSEPIDDFNRHHYIPSNRKYPLDSRLEPRTEPRTEPRVLHYYTGYDYFATIDPSDRVVMRRDTPTIEPSPSVRYRVNPPYYSPSDYIKSTL